jgi:hypothetical protein
VTQQEQWRIAFAEQSASDLQVYAILSKVGGLPVCHRLHYLQMHLEKLAKSYLYQASPTFEHVLHHNVVSKVLPQLVRRYARGVGVARTLDTATLNELRDICREIDLLQPGVDDDRRRPDNCEYPWLAIQNGQEQVVVPMRASFRVDQRLRTPLGRLLLKVAAYLCQRMTQA